ncbi:MAG: DUF992 domain-containing protein [Alphaproteobacteria bacterium]|nr:DUF992 domain-containing protein [Alphaproteobacteria bacterium]MBV8406501.1 DUF992 domain-containing protein [Alphaproteobacteria bacterium]
MLRTVLAAMSGAALLVGAAASSYSQTPAAPGTASASGRAGVNVGSLTCNVSGGVGFVFGSSKELSCLFNRTDGVAERYTGTIRKFGVDIGFTKEAQVVWLVFAPGSIASGSLQGAYAGATAGGSVGVGAAANVLVGGSNKQITLQPVSVEGSVGLNVAVGIGEIELKYVPKK